MTSGESVQVTEREVVCPGTILQHTTGGQVTLAERKPDDSGWWNADQSGFSDEALSHGLLTGIWKIVGQEPPLQPYARRVTSRPPTTVWCCSCDRELTDDDMGPLNHLGKHPRHRIIEAIGEFFIWEIR